MSEFKTNDKYYPWAVSREGKVKNLKTGKDYHPKIGTHGYYYVSKYLLHRILADIYIPNPENKPQVNHIDSVRTNNSLDNLEWVTQKENIQHAAAKGRIGKGIKTIFIISDETIHAICRDIIEGHRNIDIAKRYSISAGYVKGLRGCKSRIDITSLYDMKPTNKKSVSDTTVHWVCQCLVKGMTQTEIVDTATNKLVTVNLIKNIRKKTSYRYISDMYF